MKRGLLTYLVLAIVCISAHGKRHDNALPKITFGAEWGYMPALISGYHYNFFSPDGYRVDSKDAEFIYATNGEVTLHVGYNMNPKWNLSLHAGYAGAADFQPVIPLSLRLTHYLGDSYLEDRWLIFGDVGSGICIKERPQEMFACKVGGGYRISLSRHTKLDFIAAIRMLYTHPEVVYYGNEIDFNRINRNDGHVGSLFLGISLTF